ncbi:Serine/threonine-protein phosphatase 2B catalytic subunit A1 [Phytophthora ramorum]|uniref:Serine/threonine-protein phosphatase 2B catalytic subunit A1 n=1 Tax=Phytophthora ramorum TaxID=164328 RepID=UPI0030A1E529|nr:Serine/threonine-protein phosphatase 2B catalytic subunit A1 [Phytophthora ramorum]
MASKLNAFLAAVPANASVPSPPKSAPAALAFPQLELKAAPDSVGFYAPATPQPPMARRRRSSSLRKCNPNLKLALDASSSNQELDGPEEDRDVTRPSPLKSFMAAQATAAKMTETHALDLTRTGSGADLDAKSEAGPMRMASMQGSHHRRVSTDTTLFNRYLRQQADRDIGQDTVQHFGNVPVITATAAGADALESEMIIDNNADEEHARTVMHVLDPEEILALFRLGSTIPVSSALEIVRRATNLMSLEQNEQEWVPNSMRGCSFTFNERACREFLKRNNLLAIVRAHELEENGYKEHFRHEADRAEENEDGELVLPAVVTVFSAPEYCNTNHNVGATLKIPWEKENGRLLQYQQHKRSQYAEFAFTRPSEEEAVKAFLEENLPFLPIDFYDLVNVCRQLRFTLERAASITASLSPATDPHRKLSFVSSLCAPATTLENKIEEEDPELPVSPPSSAPITDLEGKYAEHSTTDTCEAVGESLQDWELVGESKSAEPADDAAKKSKKDMKKKKKERKLKEKMEKRQKKQKEKEKKKWDTGRIVSGWKFCPGFVRFYDRYFARDGVKKNGSEITSAPGHLGKRASWIPHYKTPFKRSTSTGEAPAGNEVNDTVTETIGPVRRKSMTDWMPMPSFEQVAQLTTTLQGHIPIQASGINVFTKAQWQALKLYFSLLDLDGNGVLVEESFVVLLAEQDSDAYATEDELSLLMEVMDCNADNIITEQDFLLFAYRALLRWKKALHGSS